MFYKKTQKSLFIITREFHSFIFTKTFGLENIFIASSSSTKRFSISAFVFWSLSVSVRIGIVFNWTSKFLWASFFGLDIIKKSISKFESKNSTYYLLVCSKCLLFLLLPIYDDQAVDLDRAYFFCILPFLFWLLLFAVPSYVDNNILNCILWLV